MTRALGEERRRRALMVFSELEGGGEGGREGGLVKGLMPRSE